MDAATFPPGSHVMHPRAWPCLVRGVRTDALAGDVLAIERVSPLTGLVLVPLSKLGKVELRALTAAEANAAANRWEPPRGKWAHVPRDLQRARRVAELRGLKMAS